MSEETSKNEILEAIGTFADHTEEQFTSIKTNINRLQETTEKRFDGLESRVTKIEANMVTKDYLDDKLADLKGDLIVLIRKEDTKLAALVEVLKERKVIDDDDIRKILSMEPFPKSL